jgi:excisionase family DNA binding protein
MNTGKSSRDQREKVSARDQPRFLTVKAVAKELCRSKARVYELVASGELRSVRDGRSVLIPVGEPERWIQMKLRQKRR